MVYKPSIELSKGGRNVKNSIFALYKKNKSSQIETELGIFQKFMLYPLVFPNIFKLMFIWKIYLTIYFTFYTILFNNIMIKYSDIYVIFTWYLLQDINNNCKKYKHPTLYVSSSCSPRNFSWNIQTINIADIFVIILSLYNLSIELSKGGRNIQHLMLEFQKENITSQNIIQKGRWQHLFYHLC